jgi:hypothetical protein
VWASLLTSTILHHKALSNGYGGLLYILSQRGKEEDVMKSKDVSGVNDGKVIKDLQMEGVWVAMAMICYLCRRLDEDEPIKCTI